jgi:hypothetical protein
VVDAGLAPQLKVALLSGYLNRLECPTCGAAGVLNLPLAYHDPDKELLLVLLPTELNLSAEQQQRLIGSLVQAVMSHVPAEERKGYFLRPQTVLTMQRLVELILEADGVTREMIDAQSRRLAFVGELLRASDDEAQLATLIQERRGDIDYAFFATLVSAAEEAEVAGDTAGAEQLLALRDRLLQDPELADRLPQPLAPDATMDEILEKLLALSDDEQALAAMVAFNRPAFDYLFFQGLTGQLEQAQRAGDAHRAARLIRLRARLLEEIEQQDQALHAAQQQDLRLIEEILKSPDRHVAIRQHLPQIDTLFLHTLTGAIEAARREGDIARSARLDELRQALVTLLAEAMPPELRLVNRLLALEEPSERQAVLAESGALLSDDFVALIDGLIQEMRSQNRDEPLGRLQAIQAEVQQARTTDRAPKQPT